MPLRKKYRQYDYAISDIISDTTNEVEVQPMNYGQTGTVHMVDCSPLICFNGVVFFRNHMGLPLAN